MEILSIILFSIVIGWVGVKFKNKYGLTMYELLTLMGMIAFIIIIVMIGYFYLKSYYLM